MLLLLLLPVAVAGHDDSCVHSRDNECDHGTQWCDWGTDCTDCNSCKSKRDIAYEIEGERVLVRGRLGQC